MSTSAFQGLALPTSYSANSSTTSTPGPSSRASPPKKRKRLNQANKRDPDRALDEADDIGDEDLIDAFEPQRRVRIDDEGEAEDSEDEEGGDGEIGGGAGGVKKVDHGAEITRLSKKRRGEQ